jgi:hypothetical protein
MPLVGEVSAQFADRECHVVSVTDSYGRILGSLDRRRSSNSSIVFTRLSGPHSRPTTSQKILYRRDKCKFSLKYFSLGLHFNIYNAIRLTLKVNCVMPCYIKLTYFKYLLLFGVNFIIKFVLTYKHAIATN